MYRVETKVEIEQQPSKRFPDRKRKFTFDFLTEYEIESSWENLTDKAKVKLPKGVKVKDKNNKEYTLEGTNRNIGGFSEAEPLFLKGDKIVIYAGYRYYNDAGKEVVEMPELFRGYISNVVPKKPFVLECEDNMWKLKQLPAPSKQWPTLKYSLQKMLEECLKGTGFKVNKHAEAKVEYNVGHLTTTNETVAELLAKLKKDNGIVSYFRGDELRVGGFKYITEEAKEVKFQFQLNIIDDELAYKRKDDVVLSAVAVSTYNGVLDSQTKKGLDRTKQQKLEILIYLDTNGEFVYKEKKKGDSDNGLPPDKEGEKHSFNYSGITDPKLLFEEGVKSLQKYYYTGFRGTFTTFGLPFVKHGDNVVLEDPTLPEKNGSYKVKKVVYTGGTGGLRQKITLDFRNSS